ncbi:hypothetical protein thsrh120_59720 [Rhizobium sp. No.120]
MWKAPALREIGFAMQRISSAVVCPAFDAAIYRLLALKGSARIVPPNRLDGLLTSATLNGFG